MSPAPAPAAALRPALPGDVPVLASILRESIFGLTGEDYDEDQQEAWAAVSDEGTLAERLADRLTLVATRDGEPVGFVALADNKLVDMLYVHPDVAGEGVATLLCDAIEKLATARGAKTLSVDASDTALSLFKKRGYVAKSRNTVQREGVWLGNTTMEKTLVP
ncbi:GNAT family N-acetyltransferase [Ancylobacter pratisalsi]|nr:GNAT family N-acetyltransferase [Ancylobacter pratisalsi]